MTHPAIVLALQLNLTTHQATPVPPTLQVLLPSLLDLQHIPPNGRSKNTKIHQLKPVTIYKDG